MTPPDPIESPAWPLTPGQALLAAYVARLLGALSAASGNKERAAASLGMPVRRLNDHLSRLGLQEVQAEIWSRAERQPQRHSPLVTQPPVGTAHAIGRGTMKKPADTVTDTDTLYFARYGATQYDRDRATYEPAATLAAVTARCVADGTCAELMDVVGFGAGQVHADGAYKPSRSRYARS